MSQKTLSIVVRAVDQATAPLRNVAISLGGVGEKASSSSKRIESALGSIRGSIASLATLAAAYLSVKSVQALGAAAVNAARRVAEEMDQVTASVDAVGKAAERLGLSVGMMSELRYAAKINEVEFDSLASAVATAERNVAQFALTGGGKAAEAIKRLGLSLKDSQGNIRGIRDLLPEMFDAIRSMPDAEQGFIAQKLFGGDGDRLLFLIRQGGDELRRLGEEAKRMRVVFSPEDARLADEYRDSIDRVSEAWLGLRNMIVRSVAPKVTEFLNNVAVAIAAVPEMFATVLGAVDKSMRGFADQSTQNLAAWSRATKELFAVATGEVVQAVYTVASAGLLYIADRLLMTFGTKVGWGIMMLGKMVPIGIRFLVTQIVQATTLVATAVAGVAQVAWAAVKAVFQAGVEFLIGSVGGWVARAVSAVAKSIGDTIVPVASAMNAALPGSGVALFAFSEQIKASVKSIGEGADAYAKIVEGMPNPAAEAARTILAKANEVKDSLAQSQRAYMEAGAGYLQMAQDFKDLITMEAGGEEFLLNSQEAARMDALLARLRDGFAGMGDRLKDVSVKWGDAAAAATGYADAVKVHAIPAMDEFERKTETSLRGQRGAWGQFFDGVKDGWTQFKDSVQSATDLGRELTNDVLNSFSSKMSVAIVDAIAGVKSFGEAMRDVFASILRMISEAIMKWLIMKAIMGIAGGFAGGGGSGTTGGGWEGGGGAVYANRGGYIGRRGLAAAGMGLAAAGATVPGFAGGGYVPGGGVNTDSVLAMLTTREGVLNRAATARAGGKAAIDYANRGGTLAPAGGGGGGGMVVNITINAGGGGGGGAGGGGGTDLVAIAKAAEAGVLRALETKPGYKARVKAALS